MQAIFEFDEVITLLGGASTTARMCTQYPSAICNWRAKGRFPCKYYWVLRWELEAKGYCPAIALFNFYSTKTQRRQSKAA